MVDDGMAECGRVWQDDYFRKVRRLYQLKDTISDPTRTPGALRCQLAETTTH